MSMYDRKKAVLKKRDIDINEMVESIGNSFTLRVEHTGGKVYTEIIDDVSSKTLLPIIRWKVNDDSIINTDGRKSYDWLVDLWYEKHYRVNHSANEFSKWDWKHINWIESYWSFTKRRLNKFNGIKKEKYNLHLKESEFRFNYTKDKQIEILRNI